MRGHDGLERGARGCQDDFVRRKGTHDIVGIVGEFGPQIDVAKCPFQPKLVQMLVKLFHVGESGLPRVVSGREA